MILDDEGFIIPGGKKVALKPYQSRPFKHFELMSDQEIIDGAGGTLIADTECYKNYFLIAFKDIKTKKIIRFEIPGSFNERQLSLIMHSYRTIGFNSNMYDLPMIWFAYTNQSNEAIKQASNELIYDQEWLSQFQKNHNFTIFPTNHIDLIEVCPLRGSLKLYGARLHAQRIQELPFPDHMELTPDQIAIVADYNLNYLDNTELLFDNLTEQLQLRENLTREYGQDVRSKSDAQIAETVISSEIKKITGVWPKKPKIDGELLFNYQRPSFLCYQTIQLQNMLMTISKTQFAVSPNGRLEIPKEIQNLKMQIGKAVYRLGIGGLHSSEVETAFKANEEYEIIDRDVTSYYPKIVLNQKLAPKHIGEVFLIIYSRLVESRLEDKKAKRLAQAENKKVIVNGTFGKTGSPHSVLYAPQMTIQIVITGQLALLMLIEYMELQGFQIISANTDGIVIYCQRSRKQYLKAIVNQWEQMTGFETEETNYSAVYSRDVNAYLAVKTDGTVKGKNVYYDPWRSTSAKDLYWRFQKNPNAQICVEAIEKLVVNGTPIEDTIRQSNDITRFVSVKNVKGGAHKDGEYLGKVVRWYISSKVVGTINYVLNDHKVPDTDNARPCMDLPEQFPTDINYNWYIAKTKEMLEDMAYLPRPKQMSFF